MWFLLLVSTLHTLVVATSDKCRTSFAVVKNNLLLRVCMKFEYITKVPYWKFFFVVCSKSQLRRHSCTCHERLSAPSSVSAERTSGTQHVPQMPPSGSVLYTKYPLQSHWQRSVLVNGCLGFRINFHIFNILFIVHQRCLFCLHASYKKFNILFIVHQRCLFCLHASYKKFFFFCTDHVLFKTHKARPTNSVGWIFFFNPSFTVVLLCSQILRSWSHF